MKDWIGNKNSVYVCNGASNHSEEEREIHDYYATDPNSLMLFLNQIKKDNFTLHKHIWECACGAGHLSKTLEAEGYDVYSSDLIDRGYGIGNKDFMKASIMYGYDILTNPPYKYAQEFVEHALEILEDGYFCIMYLKIQFLEGQARKKLFEKYPPKYIYVNSTRQMCYINGDMSEKKSSASCYCWFIWQKGCTQPPTIRWI